MWCWWMLVSGLSTLGADEQPAPPTISREVRDLEGWKVHVDRQLLEGPQGDLGKDVLRVLSYKLYEVKKLVAEDRLVRLQKVGIVVDLDYPRLTAMQYHPSLNWLKANGHDPFLEKKVHIPRARPLTTRLPVNQQPMVILHELSHAYHDQVLGFDHPKIKEAWIRFQEAGKYEKVLHISGSPRKHYALTTPMEFFAEMSEAYFGTNDFYPFVHSELREELPDTFNLLEKIWGKVRDP